MWPQTISAITHSARVLLELEGILNAVDDGRASVTLRSYESVERGLHIQDLCVGGVPNLILPSVLFGRFLLAVAWPYSSQAPACCLVLWRSLLTWR